MKKVVFILNICVLFVSCGSSSFERFYNTHKTDIGATSFQIPNFMKAVLGNISPEIHNVIGNIEDFKYIKLENLNTLKRQSIIAEMNALTTRGYKDMLRKNALDNTRIISVKELGVVVSDVIFFNSNEIETTAFYLKGNFDSEKIKSFSDEDAFNKFTNTLLQSYINNTNLKINIKN
jgi:hypothetical protein